MYCIMCVRAHVSKHAYWHACVLCMCARAYVHMCTSVCRCECMYMNAEARDCSLAAIHLVFYKTLVLPLLDLSK